MFGPMNSVKVGEKRVLFRPDEYVLEEAEGFPRLNLQFVEALFLGSIYENHFLTEQKEKVVLYSFNLLDHVRSISVRWKDKKLELERKN